MAEIIQHILSLPRLQQIAIIQAITAQWQIEEGQQNKEQEDILSRQLAYVEAVSEEVKNGNMATISFEDYKKKIESSSTSRKYDFSDLLGQLSWVGNTLAEQQRLRDEW